MRTHTHTYTHSTEEYVRIKHAKNHQQQTDARLNFVISIKNMSTKHHVHTVPDEMARTHFVITCAQTSHRKTYFIGDGRDRVLRQLPLGKHNFVLHVGSRFQEQQPRFLVIQAHKIHCAPLATSRFAAWRACLYLFGRSQEDRACRVVFAVDVCGCPREEK